MLPDEFVVPLRTTEYVVFGRLYAYSSTALLGAPWTLTVDAWVGTMSRGLAETVSCCRLPQLLVGLALADAGAVLDAVALAVALGVPDALLDAAGVGVSVASGAAMMVGRPPPPPPDGLAVGEAVPDARGEAVPEAVADAVADALEVAVVLGRGDVVALDVAVAVELAAGELLGQADGLADRDALALVLGVGDAAAVTV